MSDSEVPDPVGIPADTEIEQCLSKVVRDALRIDEEISINVARSRAETILKLDSGFFKDDATWRAKSKQIVQATVEDPTSPVKAKKATPKPQVKSEARAGTKRKSDESQPKKKRQKKNATPPEVEDDVLAEDVDEADSPAPAKKARAAKTTIGDSEDDEEMQEARVESNEGERSALSEPADELAAGDESEKSSATDEPIPHKRRHKKSAARAATNSKSKTPTKPSVDDESDMSSVLDEPLPKKKRQKKSASTVSMKDNVKRATKPAKATKELSADDEEIKRLQGWLVKCGIRKVWSKELAKCDTSKAKIKHLKGLLDEAGMTGRYSADKAKSIKNKRELLAEIEAVQEFNDQWGGKKDGENEEEVSAVEENVKTRRLKPRKLIDWGDSGDEGSD
ncbi:hypothetical protein LTR62_000800 [Meristemomyces frigidus]|uniref:Transcriptional regulator n=1 Tax=Meristemomyces frigidus TaxID=1508187 RepID=A0AAN7YSR8_9PEZI|nr:hypothetical protein LTR62_000800 [Meristemomyces frigidus]